MDCHFKFPIIEKKKKMLILLSALNSIKGKINRHASIEIFSTYMESFHIIFAAIVNLVTD